jgi:hypothetical protein
MKSLTVRDKKKVYFIRKIFSVSDKYLWAEYKGYILDIHWMEDEFHTGFYTTVEHPNGGYDYDGWVPKSIITLNEAILDALKGSMII